MDRPICSSISAAHHARAPIRSTTSTLPETLAAYQIGHVRIAQLGGRRPKTKSVAPEINAFWTNQSFHNYADYAMSGEFQAGLDQLRDLTRDRRCAVMCSEAVWWRCHRRFVADYLLAEGREVFHLMGADRIEPARMTAVAMREGRALVYPREG